MCQQVKHNKMINPNLDILEESLLSIGRLSALRKVELCCQLRSIFVSSLG